MKFDIVDVNQLNVNRKKQQHLRINRRYLRIDADIPCEVGVPGEKRRSARILNLSAGGLKFSCDQETFHRIIPEDQRTPGPVLDVEIEIQFALQPGEHRETAFDTRASVVHSERLAQDLFHVGIQFSDLDNAVVERLEAYIGKPPE